jgi:predicted component of type VI protein secretion system
MAASDKAGSDPLLMALACGATVTAAAAKAGVSERTAYRRLAHPEFAARLEALRGEMVQRAAAMLTASALEAVKTLLELQSPSTPPAVRLRAAAHILDYGLRLREAAALETRLAALEQRLQAPAPDPLAPPNPPSVTVEVE